MTMESSAVASRSLTYVGINWIGLRDRASVPASIILTICLVVMWWANIASLVETGGFAGIAGWLIPGIVVVTMRSWLLSMRLVKEWPETTWKDRRRLFWQLIPTVGNLVANAYAIYLIVHNIETGALRWGHWDSVCTCVALGTLLLMIGLRSAITRMSPRLFVAGVGVGTRVFQQGMLAISPQMKLILWGTPVGLCGIASLLLFLSYVEFGAAKQADSAGLWEAQLMVWTDGSNLAAALILLAGWLATHASL
jgi:hypothetical protein